MPDDTQGTRILLIATHNAGKVREFYNLLGDVPFSLTSLKEQGVEEGVDETGATFHENAVIKAQAYSRLTGLLTLSDDSGLEVDALDSGPGIYSARYGGEGLTDEGRVDLLLHNLRGVPWNLRSARFRCVIAIAPPPVASALSDSQESEAVTVEGTVEGIIQYEPLGSGGFGYDPVFYLPQMGMTTAQLPMDQKNALSHRGQAAKKAAAFLCEWTAR